MKHVLIVENNTESLKVNESANGSSKFLLNGIFTEFDVENRNRRFYKAENFIPCMNQLLEKKKTLGVLYGEYGHPEEFNIGEKFVSHAIEDLTYNESSNRVDGQIAVLNTTWGKDAKAIIEDGYPLFVSSRAAGVTNESGNVSLKELFTYDIVVDPGFASARVSVNESYGFSDAVDVPYRIYEMNDGQVNNLFNDNKNDNKTKMDLKQMETILSSEMAKLEHKLIKKITEGKTPTEDIRSLMENYESVSSELTNVKEYLVFFKKQMQHMVKQNTKLTTEINEQVAYSNHLAKSLKKLNTYATEINERLSTGEEMIEYVAEHTKTNISKTDEVAKFAEYVANETLVSQKFIEHVANESLNTRKFAEYTANETKITQKFAEHVANETKIAQKYAEHIANESNGDSVYLAYIADKVDGVVGYNEALVSKLKSTTPINESNADSIHNLESIVEYLGLDDEQSVVNNVVENETEEEMEENETEEGTSEDDTLNLNNDINLEEGESDEELGENTELGHTLVNALVKVLGSDDTGIVIEVTEDGKIIIQKSGCDDTCELADGEFEVLDTEDNITETVSNVLAELKKQKVLNNKQPHFFTFLSESQITDFKLLEKSAQDSIILVMNESEYMSSDDVLNIIGNTLNANKTSYEENLINNLPVNLKESWNSLTNDIKLSVITESKYFNLNTSSDITNFWKTRSFAKATTSAEATLIKESVNLSAGQELNDDYINAFLNSIENLK